MYVQVSPFGQRYSHRSPLAWYGPEYVAGGIFSGTGGVLGAEAGPTAPAVVTPPWWLLAAAAGGAFLLWRSQPRARVNPRRRRRRR